VLSPDAALVSLDRIGALDAVERRSFRPSARTWWWSWQARAMGHPADSRPCAAPQRRLCMAVNDQPGSAPMPIWRPGRSPMAGAWSGQAPFQVF